MKVAQQWVRMGRVQSFMLILGRVGSGWVTLVVGRVGSGQENWTHVQLCNHQTCHITSPRQTLNITSKGQSSRSQGHNLKSAENVEGNW